MEIRELKHPSAKEFAETTAVLTQSFWRMPLFYDFLFRGRRRQAEIFLAVMLRYSLRAGRVFVADQEGRGVVACALWTGPTAPDPDWKTVFRLGLWPGFLRLALHGPGAIWRIDEMFTLLDNFAPETACATLEFLAASEKGAGAAVLKRSMEAFAGLPLYVESIVSKNDHAYYRRFGFVPFARTDFHGTDYAFLLFPPVGAPSA
jgi:hypothetical protein